MLLSHSKEAEPPDWAGTRGHTWRATQGDATWAPGLRAGSPSQIWGRTLSPGGGDREVAHVSSKVPSASSIWDSDIGNHWKVTKQKLHYTKPDAPTERKSLEAVFWWLTRRQDHDETAQRTTETAICMSQLQCCRENPYDCCSVPKSCLTLYNPMDCAHQASLSFTIT